GASPGHAAPGRARGRRRGTPLSEGLTLSGPTPTPRSRWPLALGLAFGLAFWLTLLIFPAAVTGPDLDGSWGLCLAHFLKTRAQAGPDYAFTYGPLGYLAAYAYDADLFAVRVAWELSVAALFAGLVVEMLRRLPGWPLRLFGG